MPRRPAASFSRLRLALLLGIAVVFVAAAPVRLPATARIAPPSLVTAATDTSPRAPYVTPDSSAGIPTDIAWENFTTADGLPSDKVFCVRMTPDAVWAGTDSGLARFADGRWQTFGVGDGLPHRAVLSLDFDARTGDLWVGTMGGLARWSAGRFDVFNQLNSGLSNDFVHAIACDPATGETWAATAMGLCRYAPRTQRWEVFTERNTPMHEPWTYSVSVDRGRVYVGAWGGGVLEYDEGTGAWREYRDPDKEMEIDLLPDDGPIHDVTAGVAYRGGVLWQATYFGLARYDGRGWQSYTAADSGLASDFINFVRAVGTQAWLCTDNGLTVSDGAAWVTFRRSAAGRNVITRRGIAGKTAAHGPGLAHNFILGVDVRGTEVWVATAHGISRGRITATALPTQRTVR